MLTETTEYINCDILTLTKNTLEYVLYYFIFESLKVKIYYIFLEILKIGN